MHGRALKFLKELTTRFLDLVRISIIT